MVLVFDDYGQEDESIKKAIQESNVETKLGILENQMVLNLID